MSCNFASTRRRLKCGRYADRLCEGGGPRPGIVRPEAGDSDAGAAVATAESPVAERHQTFFWSNRAFKPMGAIGAFFAMSLDTLVAIPRRPFALREFLVQSWFVARVSLLP